MEKILPVIVNFFSIDALEGGDQFMLIKPFKIGSRSIYVTAEPKIEGSINMYVCCLIDEMLG